MTKVFLATTMKLKGLLHCIIGTTSICTYMCVDTQDKRLRETKPGHLKVSVLGGRREKIQLMSSNVGKVSHTHIHAHNFGKDFAFICSSCQSLPSSAFVLQTTMCHHMMTGLFFQKTVVIRESYSWLRLNTVMSSCWQPVATQIL